MVKKLYHLINGIHGTMELINGTMELMQITTFSHFSACIYFLCFSESEENLTLRNRFFAILCSNWKIVREICFLLNFLVKKYFFPNFDRVSTFHGTHKVF